jgi:hypothetical protein
LTTISTKNDAPVLARVLEANWLEIRMDTGGSDFVAKPLCAVVDAAEPLNVVEINVIDTGLAGLAQRRFIAKNCHGPP